MIHGGFDLSPLTRIDGWRWRRLRREVAQLPAAGLARI
jgi:hypothetical protein